MPHSATLQGKLILLYTPLLHVALPAHLSKQAADLGGWGTALPGGNHCSHSSGGITKWQGSLTRGSNTWHEQGQPSFPHYLFCVPHLVVSPHASHSPGWTEMSQRICEAELTTGVWACNAPQSRQHVGTYRDHHSLPVDLQESLQNGNTHSPRIYLAHRKILKRPKQNLSSANPSLITLKGYNDLIKLRWQVFPQPTALFPQPKHSCT